MDINTFVETFCKSFEKAKDLERFISFMSFHPDMLFSGVCLLYAQNPDAGRTLIHRGIGDQKGYEMNIPYALPKLIDENQKIVKTKTVYYGGPKEEQHIDLRVCIDRLGYSIVTSENISDGNYEIDNKNRTVTLPYGHDDPLQKEILYFLVDFFLDALKDREFPYMLKEDKEYIYIKPLLYYMSATLLGIDGCYYPKSVKIYYDNANNKQVFLEKIYYLYVEFDQIVEGRHFTIPETEMFREMKGIIKYTDDAAFDFENEIWASYALWNARYLKDEFKAMDYKGIHIFPLFRVDEAIEKNL